jgi:hypothetical protein
MEAWPILEREREREREGGWVAVKNLRLLRVEM